MIPLIRAQQIADRVMDQLRPYCTRIEVAGSIRRQRPEVKDIDLVMHVRDMPGLIQRINAKCRIEKQGEQYLEASMTDGTQLDIWFAHQPVAVQEDFFGCRPGRPDNFGSLLLSRTGSAWHNIALCQRANRLGMHWNPHQGVYQDGVCIASATEADIYQALGLEFITPTARELDGRDARYRLIQHQRENKLTQP